MATQGGGSGFWSKLGQTSVDLLDEYGGAYIKDKFGESGQERSEGPTEYANPATVTQPVTQSQTPGGLPLNMLPSQLGVSTGMLKIGGIVFGGLVLLKLLKVI